MTEDHNDIERWIDDALGATRHATRDRPYNGPPQTNEGERGKTHVDRLTIRDICDCMAMGLLEASGKPELMDVVEKGTWMYKDLYVLGDFDPIAAIQNASVHIEKMMGIFPNIAIGEMDKGESP